MDVHDKLDELAAVIEGARAVPMSASCMVNRGDLLSLVDEVRRLLPHELIEAERLLRDREGVVTEARLEAERVIAAGHDERMRLVSDTDVMTQAEIEARRVVGMAAEEVATMRQEVDDYVDAKLANFELVLSKTMEAVHRGREKIEGRRAVEELGELTSFAPEDDGDQGLV